MTNVGHDQLVDIHTELGRGTHAPEASALASTLLNSCKVRRYSTVNRTEHLENARLHEEVQPANQFALILCSKPDSSIAQLE